MDLPKEYYARIRFGVTTTTDDLCGDVVCERRVESWDDERMTRAVEELVGEFEQKPPAVSAIKLAGKRSYRLVRDGKTPDLPARRVRVYAAEVLSMNPPEAEVRISCSRGTYIRSIARDLGESMGWGGALSALVRTAVGSYRVEQALALDDIQRRATEFMGD